VVQLKGGKRQAKGEHERDVNGKTTERKERGENPNEAKTPED